MRLTWTFLIILLSFLLNSCELPQPEVKNKNYSSENIVCSDWDNSSDSSCIK